MPREFMCQFGNCQETENLRITITDKGFGERARFCCYEHAALWLLRRGWMSEGGRKLEYLERAEKE